MKIHISFSPVFVFFLKSSLRQIFFVFGLRQDLATSTTQASVQPRASLPSAETAWLTIPTVVPSLSFPSQLHFLCTQSNACLFVTSQMCHTLIHHPWSLTPWALICLLLIFSKTKLQLKIRYSLVCTFIMEPLQSVMITSSLLFYLYTLLPSAPTRP